MFLMSVIAPVKIQGREYINYLGYKIDFQKIHPQRYKLESLVEDPKWFLKITGRLFAYIVPYVIKP